MDGRMDRPYWKAYSGQVGGKHGSSKGKTGDWKTPNRHPKHHQTRGMQSKVSTFSF